MEFKPYKDNEYLENSYYKIPQELFVSSLYKDKLNSDSKILYAFLLDRLSLSQKNHWIDDERNIYLIFTREEVQENLIQLLDILKNIPNIQNAKNYLMICLYNNLGNTNISISKKKENKVSYKGRDYEDGSLDFLYANFAYDNEAITS